MKTNQTTIAGWMQQVCCHLQACNLQSQKVWFHRVTPDPWIRVAQRLLLPYAPPSGNAGTSPLPLVSSLPYNSCTEKSFLGFHDLCKKIIPVNPRSQQPGVGEGKARRGRPSLPPHLSASLPRAFPGPPSARYR